MAKIEQPVPITIKDIVVTKFPKLDELSHGNFEAYGSREYTFYLPIKTELELTAEEKEFQEYKPTMANIDFTKKVSQESIDKVNDMDDEILRDYTKAYRCTKEQYIHIYDQITTSQPIISDRQDAEQK